MREILFRGKTPNNIWIYGNLNYYPDINRTFIRKNDKKLCPSMQSSLEEEVSKKTVGQYTGLTDKNGKKIFEGDIVKFCTELKEICFVDYGKGKYILRQLKKDKYLSWQSIDIFELFGLEWEVIGNIHDNPELMEGAKQ